MKYINNQIYVSMFLHLKEWFYIQNYALIIQCSNFQKINTDIKTFSK